MKKHCLKKKKVVEYKHNNKKSVRGMQVNERVKILVVDDVEINRLILLDLLEEKYEIIQAQNGAEALDIINARFSELSLILLDLMMPVVDGFTVLEKLKENNLTHIPVIIITASDQSEQEKRGFVLGAVDYITKPFDPDIVRYRVETHVKLKMYQTHLEELVQQGVEELNEMWLSAMQSMADIIEYRSQESGEHVKRTSRITRMIVDKMNTYSRVGYFFTPKQSRYVGEAAALHDIGKVGIPDNILLKPGKLTNEEFDIMKTHAAIGFEMAQTITKQSPPDYRKYCGEICLSHHERWEGTGYPNKLKETQIPLAARIVCIADTYDAITCDRVYRKGAPHEVAVEEIVRMSGKQFDPFLVEIFLSIEQEIKAGLSEISLKQS